MLHKLRIAFTAVCGIACLWLMLLWMRSYRWNDIAYRPLNSTPQILSVYSFRGRITIAALVPVEDDDLMKSRDPTAWGWEPQYVGNLVPLDDEEEKPRPLFEFRILLNGGYTTFPHWFAILIAGAVAVATWIRWRLSLRTLLIATALVAVVLGAVVYAV
jgi:hypothetical protein